MQHELINLDDKLAQFIDLEMVMISSYDLVIEVISMETGKSKESPNEGRLDKSSHNGAGDEAINSIGIGGECD